MSDGDWTYSGVPKRWALIEDIIVCLDEIQVVVPYKNSSNKADPDGDSTSKIYFRNQESVTVNMSRGEIIDLLRQ